jgi:hypothetical protein
MTSAEIEILLRQIGIVVVKTGEIAAELESRTIPNPGMFGDPAPTERREALRVFRQEVAQLREALGIEQ